MQQNYKPIRLTGAAMKPLAPPAPTKLYECGTVDGCPRQNISILGISFHAFRGTPTIGTDGSVKGASGLGMRAHMTQKHLAAVIEAIQHKVVRMYSNGRGDVFDDRDQGFVAKDADRRLAEFLFMREVTDDGVAAETAKPETMAPVAAQE